MKKVHIVGGDQNIARMFRARGWGITPTILGSFDLLQYTGGADVDPSYYKEGKHAKTWSSPYRDAAEAHVFNSNIGGPQAGICRGGQFLNVMCGGKMYQHVNNHAIGGTHRALTRDGKEIMVTSTHHQMMRPAAEATWLLEASLSTSRETATTKDVGLHRDCEAVYYNRHNTICYQPHPECCELDEDCQEYYFECLKLIV